MSSTAIHINERHQTFKIKVLIRDKNGKIYLDSKGIKLPSIDFEISVVTWEQLEYQLQGYYRAFKVLKPEAKITLEAGIYNSISYTIMNMASYYGNERKFVKH